MDPNKGSPVFVSLFPSGFCFMDPNKGSPDFVSLVPSGFSFMDPLVGRLYSPLDHMPTMRVA